jgi:hypothetical protein
MHILENALEIERLALVACSSLPRNPATKRILKRTFSWRCQKPTGCCN